MLEKHPFSAKVAQRHAPDVKQNGPPV